MMFYFLFLIIKYWITFNAITFYFLLYYNVYNLLIINILHYLSYVPHVCFFITIKH